MIRPPVHNLLFGCCFVYLPQNKKFFRGRPRMQERCIHCNYPIILYNPACTSHKAIVVLTPTPVRRRKGPQTHIEELHAKPHVHALLLRFRYTSPQVLVLYIEEVTGIDVRKVLYCTEPRQHEAGELFAGIAYFGMGLTQSEVAEYARHSSLWASPRVRSFMRKLSTETFVAKIRCIALHMENRHH
jgi:hypothetical protein